MIKPEAKAFFNKLVSKIKLVYLIFLHVLVLLYTPYIKITHQVDQDGRIYTISIELPFTNYNYKETVVFLNE